MTGMDLDRKPDGRLHFSLGPVEKTIVGAIGAGIAVLTYWLIGSMQTVLTQQAVTNSQLSNLSGQLLDLPAIRAQNAELKVRVDGLESDVRELRAVKGLR